MVNPSGRVTPLVSFQPLADPHLPATGSESEGASGFAVAPKMFPAGLNHGVFVGFHGLFNEGGTDNEEIPGLRRHDQREVLRFHQQRRADDRSFRRCGLDDRLALLERRRLDGTGIRRSRHGGHLPDQSASPLIMTPRPGRKRRLRARRGTDRATDRRCDRSGPRPVADLQPGCGGSGGSPDRPAHGSDIMEGRQRTGNRDGHGPGDRQRADASLTGSTSFSLIVNNVAPQVYLGPTPPRIPVGPFTVVGSFSDPGPDRWTATVSYEDRTKVAKLALKPNKTFTLAHRYSKRGTYTITVKVTDFMRDRDQDNARLGHSQTQAAPR